MSQSHNGVLLVDKLKFNQLECAVKTYLFWDINEGGGSQLGEGVQGDNDHWGGGVRADQMLQEISAARGQAGIMVHVLQHGDQL